MAAAVDPFSVATAELSEDYIKIFPNPDTIPKYLEELSEKTGVVVFAVDNSINLKGSWVSLKRVRSFLTEFVASCEVTECEDNKEDVDLLDFEGQPVSVAVESIHEEDDPTLDDVASFHDDTGEQSDWIKWTAEVLPQIQPVRSKRACEYSVPKTEENMIPEPLVLYANYQPAPDPDAKVPATLDAIEKVLKTVYDSNEQKTPELSESAPTLVIDHPTTTEHTDIECPQTENFTEHYESMVGLTNQNQVELEVSFSISGHNSPHKSEESYSATHDDDDDDGDQGTLSTMLDSPTSSPVTDAVADMVLSHQQSQSQEDLGNTNPTPSQSSTLARKQSKGMPKRQSRRKRKDSKLNVDYSRDSGEVHSVTEFRNKDYSEDQVTVHTNNYSMCTSSVQSDSKSKVKETRRKGRPKKNINYQSETSVSNKDSRPENIPLTATKRKNLMPIQAVLPKPSPALSVRKRAGKSQQSLKHEVVKEGKGFACELCPYAAKKLNHLREHKRRVHITKDKEFKCEECGKVFGFAKDLKRHCRTHQRAENCCDICGKMYKGVRNLADHKKTHNTDYIKPEFPCKFCEKVFSTKYVLAYHIKSEHLGLKKTFICPTCGKSFSQKNSYLQHANVHMGIKPYQCDICGRSFSYEKSLKEHKFMHQDDKQFECHVCHKKFRQSSGVAIHMRIHKERKDYVCSACGKGFSQKQAMIRHERIHAGEKPFSCSLCKRSFTDSSILRRHMILIHKKEKDKWQEDTENNVQRRTDFFITVVSKEMEKGQTSHQDAGYQAVTMSENSSVQEVAKQSAVEPECCIDDDASCDANDAVDLNIIPVEDVTVTSMPQPLSSSYLSTTVISTVPSMSLAQFSKAGYEAANCHSVSDTMPLVGIHNPLAAGIHDLQPDTVFSMSLETAQSNLTASLSQPVCVSLPNGNQISLQEQTSVLNSYHAFSEPNSGSSSQICSAQLQQSSASAADLPVYPEMVAEDHADYQPHTVLMSDALAATVQFHAGSISGVSSSSLEQTVKCDLLSDPSLLQ